ncbi:hypothetical protein [uncultured Microscilla sp.]|uniref:hypothetical protein n=1 Tax=uncultured Microscilla sp. TaxID=432653 RepID=UPI002638004B|nr:hypothetical protein [uncultured Microscilla sp.]
MINTSTQTIKAIALAIKLMFCLCLTVHIAQAQTQNIPPSPNAAALEKFADVPISLYTGIPNVSVPIYQLKSRTLSVPVSLSYHYTGFQPNTTPSWVGLGWALNAGGVITRTVKGKSDNAPDGYWSLENPIKGDAGYEPYGNHDDWVFLDAVANGRIKDTQPDLYSFNVGGASGKFFIKRNTNGSFAAYTIPYQDVKIEIPADIDSTVIRGDWIITLPDGTKYTFGGTGLTEETSVSNESGGQGSGERYISAWYLKKIESVNGDDEINFVYTVSSGEIGYQATVAESRSFAQTIGQALCNGANSQSQSYHEVKVFGRLHIKEIRAKTGHKVVFHETAENRQDYQDKALDRIEVVSANGNIVQTHQLSFGYMGPPLPSIYKGYLLLTKVQQVAPQGNLTKGAYEFSYHRQSNPGLVSRQGSLAIDHWGYYNGAQNSTLIPDYINTNGSIIHKGANREVNPEAVKIGVLTKMTYPTGGEASFDWESNVFFDNKSCNGYLEKVATTTQVGTSFSKLHNGRQTKRITFVLDTTQWVSVYTSVIDHDITESEVFGQILRPIRGDTNNLATYFSMNKTGLHRLHMPPGTYILEASAWAAPNFLPDNQAIVSAHIRIDYAKNKATDGCDKPGPGLRIAKVTMTDGLNQGNDLVKEYLYHQFDNKKASSGYLPGLMPAYDTKREYTVRDNHSGSLCTEVVCQSLTLSSSSVLRGGYTKGSPIGYTNVTVLLGEAGANGRTEHEYAFMPDNGSYDNDWQRGHLLKQRTYDVHGRILQATQNHYTALNIKNDINLHRAHGITARWYKRSVCLPNTKEPGTNTMTVTHHTLVSAWHRLDQTDNYQYFYDNGDVAGTSKQEMKTVSKYYYENPLDPMKNIQHTFLTKTETTNSKGQTIVTKNYYPQDALVNLPFTSKMYRTAELLKGKYMLATPVLSISLIDNQAVGATYTEFAQEGSKLFPTKKYVAELTTPLSNMADVYQVDGAGNFVYLKLKEAYTFESEYGNLIETKAADNISSAFIWDHAHKSQVTAHVVNATAEQIAYSSFETATDWGHWSTNTPTWTVTATEQHTGMTSLQATNGVVTLQRSALPSGSYQVSFWQKGNGQTTVNGTAASLVKTLPSGWSLYQTTINNATSVTLNVAQGVYLDELRLHPVNAQMTTFNHQLLVGLVSKTDANQQTIYYQYDGLNRLQLLRDFEGNILKRYTYQYKNK